MKSSIYNITSSAVFVALMAVCAQLSIPLPSGIALTLQIFAVSLTGYCSKTSHALVSTAVYILLGAIGIPVFSSLRGGLGALTGFSGGFIAGFIPLAVMCSFACISVGKLTRAILSLSGLILCHLMGIVYFSIYTNSSFLSSLLTVSLPYIAKDIVLIFIAYKLSVRMRKYINIR